MAELTKQSIVLSLNVLAEYDEEQAKRVIKLESDIDKYEDVLGTYLVKLSSKNLSAADSRSMSIILHSISDLERISDHAMDIVKSAEKIKERKLSFTKQARWEIITLSRAVNEMCDVATTAFVKNDIEGALRVEPYKEVIQTLSKKVKENHIKRLKKGKCSVEMGFILEDVLAGMIRVSAHCSNIALDMITIYDDDYSTHDYFRSFSDEEREKFKLEYDELIKMFPLKKKDVIMETV